jgi:hypothetical protein
MWKVVRISGAAISGNLKIPDQATRLKGRPIGFAERCSRAEQAKAEQLAADERAKFAARRKAFRMRGLSIVTTSRIGRATIAGGSAITNPTRRRHCEEFRQRPPSSMTRRLLATVRPKARNRSPLSSWYGRKSAKQVTWAGESLDVTRCPKSVLHCLTSA